MAVKGMPKQACNCGIVSHLVAAELSRYQLTFHAVKLKVDVIHSG